MTSKTLSIPKINLLEKKNLVSRIACAFFLVMSVSWFIDLKGFDYINYVALIGMLFFTIQFIFQFNIVNLVLGIISIFVSLWMAGAVLSEYSEFEVAAKEAYQFLFVGLGLSLLCLTASVLLIRSFIISEYEKE